MNILDHPLISYRYFFPRRDNPSSLTVVRAGNLDLNCYLHQPHPEAPTLVHFHGNGEVVADYLPDFASMLESWGFNLCLAEYRGYGGSDGHPALVGMMEDLDAVFDAMGQPQHKLIAFGRSVGSIYAIEFIRRFPQTLGLVVESGIADPLQRVLLRVNPREIDSTLGAMKAEAQKHLDHQSKLEAYQGQCLFLHAEHDHLVTPDHATRNHAWAGEKSKLVLFPHGDHNSIFFANQKNYTEVLHNFLQNLKASNPA